MQYKNFFKSELKSLKEQGLYRDFRNIDRPIKSFPNADESFKDNEREIPTILTTSRKLTTGVDALNVRNIVLFRPINNMIEFKQIIGRGTRLYEGKYYFTIHDFVDAYHHFNDEEWDGEPVGPTNRILDFDNSTSLLFFVSWFNLL